MGIISAALSVPGFAQSGPDVITQEIDHPIAPFLESRSPIGYNGRSAATERAKWEMSDKEEIS